MTSKAAKRETRRDGDQTKERDADKSVLPQVTDAVPPPSPVKAEEVERPAHYRQHQEPRPPEEESDEEEAQRGRENGHERYGPTVPRPSWTTKRRRRLAETWPRSSKAANVSR
jgi:hypothetical protein